MTQEQEMNVEQQSSNEAVEQTEELNDSLEEAAQEQQQTAEVPEMDFSDLPVNNNYNYQQEEESEPQGNAIDELVNRIVEKLNIPKAEAEEMVEAEGYVTKKELAEIEARAVEKAYNKIQQESRAQQIIRENIEQSSQVEKAYGTKIQSYLKNQGIEDQSLLQAAQDSYLIARMQRAQQLGRPANNPVLTPQETAQLAKEHWANFSQRYLSGRVKNSAVNTENLSPAGNAMGNTNNPNPSREDAYSNFRNKKATGKETLEDAVSALINFKK